MHDDLYAFVGGFVVGIIISFMIVFTTTNELWRSSAIERGVARYHPVTGQWEWTVPKVEAEKKETP